MNQPRNQSGNGLFAVLFAILILLAIPVSFLVVQTWEDSKPDYLKQKESQQHESNR